VLFHFIAKMTKCAPDIVDKRARKALRHVSRFARRTGISYKHAHKILSADFDYGRQAKHTVRLITYDPLCNIDCSPWPARTSDFIQPSAPEVVAPAECIVSDEATFLTRLLSCFCGRRRRR